MATQDQACRQANDHQRNVVELTQPVRPAIEHDGNDQQQRSGAECNDRLGQVHAWVINETRAASISWRTQDVKARAL